MKGHVLLVEDDEKVRAVYAMILANAGYNVTQAVSVATALMHLDPPDLSCVLLDLTLPNGHGRRVVKALSDKRNDVPVVIFSAHPNEGEWDLPVVSYLTKPVKRDVLLAAVRSAIEKFSHSIQSLRESSRRLRVMTADAQK